MKIRIIHQYFHPDLSAVSRVISQIAFDLAAHGEEVRVICSMNKYDNIQDKKLPRAETVRGVHICRCWGPSLGRRSLLANGIDMISFVVIGTLKAVFSTRADVVVLLTNPPFHASAGSLLKFLKGERFIYVVMDLYPDVVVKAGGIGEGSRVARILRRISRVALNAADAVVVLGADMRDAVVRAGADPGKVTIIPNWADPENIRPVPPDENRLRAEWGLEGKFVVEYSGNLGVSHAFDEILDVAESLSGNDDIRFLFVGGGKRMRDVQRSVAERGLSNVLFRPYQDALLLAESLSVGDAHYISLRPGFEGLVVPSKAYGIMAAGRPILYQGSETGEVARMVVRERIGYVVPPGDREGLRNRIVELCRDAEGRARMGSMAREALVERYSAENGLAAYRRLLAGKA